MHEFLLAVAIVTCIIVGLPCLLVRPLLVAIADRISGKRGNAKEIQEMRERITHLEDELRTLRVQVIGIESTQEFSTKLIETLKAEQESRQESQG